MVLTLNSAIRDYQDDRYFGAILPEAIGSLAAMAASPELLNQHREWLTGVYGHVIERMANRTMSHSDALLWAQFADAFEKVGAGRAVDVDPLSLSWLRVPITTVDSTHRRPAPEALANPYAQAFPTATAAQLQTVAGLWERLYSAHQNHEKLTAKQIAAISTLIERLVAENPDLDAFAERVRDLSRTALRAELPFDLQLQWRWLEENL